MLCIERTTSGYALTNWSRNSPIRFGEDYKPIEISLTSRFLYDLGLLDMWKRFGEKYERGEL